MEIIPENAFQSPDVKSMNNMIPVLIIGLGLVVIGLVVLWVVMTHSRKMREID